MVRGVDESPWKGDHLPPSLHINPAHTKLNNTNKQGGLEDTSKLADNPQGSASGFTKATHF